MLIGLRFEGVRETDENATAEGAEWRKVRLDDISTRSPSTLNVLGTRSPDTSVCSSAD